MKHTKRLEELRTDAAGGSTQHFAELYDLTAGELLAFIRSRAGYGVDVEEILAATYVAAWRGYQTTKPFVIPVMVELMELAETVRKEANGP